jgi:hypothetical protein
MADADMAVVCIRMAQCVWMHECTANENTLLEVGLEPILFLTMKIHRGIWKMHFCLGSEIASLELDWSRFPLFFQRRSEKRSKCLGTSGVLCEVK